MDEKELKHLKHFALTKEVMEDAVALDFSETNILKSTVKLNAKRIEQLEKENLQLLAQIDVLLQVIKES